MCKYLKDQMDSVFTPRKNIKTYTSLSENLKKNLYNEFLQNPYPKANDLDTLSEKFNLSKEKIRNWFKYQRKKDFKTKKVIITKYKKNNSFPCDKRGILEGYFRRSPELTKEILTELSQKLGCKEIFIKRWYYYRKKKLQSYVSVKNQQKESEITLKVEEKTQNEGFRPIIPKPNETNNQSNDANVLRNLANCDESVKIRLAQELFKANYMNQLSTFANYFACFEAFAQKRFIAQQIVSLQHTPPNSAFNFNFSA